MPLGSRDKVSERGPTDFTRDPMDNPVGFYKGLAKATGLRNVTAEQLEQRRARMADYTIVSMSDTDVLVETVGWPVPR